MVDFETVCTLILAESRMDLLGIDILVNMTRILDKTVKLFGGFSCQLINANLRGNNE
jgi:hypothetical protein